MEVLFIHRSISLLKGGYTNAKKNSDSFGRSNAGSSSPESPQKLADFVGIGALSDETREKEIQRCYKYGEDYLKARQYEEARKEFDRVIALDGNHDRAYAHCGSAYLGLKDFDHALEDLNQALEMDKKNAFALGHRGMTHRKMGHYKEALADFQQVQVLGHSRPWIEDELKKLRQLIKR